MNTCIYKVIFRKGLLPIAEVYCFFSLTPLLSVLGFFVQQPKNANQRTIASVSYVAFSSLRFF